MIRAGLGRSDAAGADFQRAGKLAPGKAGPRLNLGKLYLDQKQYQAAAQIFQSALDADPKSHEAARLAGDAWRLGGTSVMAKRFYRKALEISPNDAKAHAGLGMILTNTGRFPEAREELSRARDLHDDSPEARGYLGLAYALGAETPDEGRKALEHLSAARAAGEDGAQVFYGLGLANLALHDYPAAETALKEGIRSHPDVAGLYYTLSDVYAATGRPEESRAARARSAALASVRQQEDRMLEAISADPKEVSRYLAYAQWLIGRGEYSRAEPLFRQVLRLDGSNAAATRGLRLVAAHAPTARHRHGEGPHRGEARSGTSSR
jgi:uncharacterized protein (TIGR02996 family)